MLLAQPQVQEEQETKCKGWTKKILYCVLALAVFMVVIASGLKMAKIIKQVNLDKLI